MTPADLAILKAQLVRDEGRERLPYKDSRGILTVGIGRNLIAVPFHDDEIDLMFANDVAHALAAIEARLPWFEALDPVRQRVLVNMTFNLGPDGLLQFHQMLDAAQLGDFSVAAAEMLASRWATQVGARATRLAQMMRTGVDA